MEFFEAVKARASVRSFEKCDIAAAELEQIVDAGRRAPSGRNTQPCEYIVIRDEDTLEKLGRVQSCIAEASAAIGVVVDENATEFWKEDAAAAIENMLLAVAALDYASLWVEGYVLKNEAYAKELLEVPDSLRLIAVLPVSKPTSPPSQAEKKPMEEVLHEEKYGR